MNAALGSAGVALGLTGSLLGVGTIAWGLMRRKGDLVRQSRAYAWLVLAGAVLATLAMQRALVTHDYSLVYVAENGSNSTPLFYTIASMWGALEGSILLWGLVLAGYTVAAVQRFRLRLDDPVVAWASLALLAVCAFFFALMLGPANPFDVVSGAVPTDGPGPNPLLQNHVLMAIHPPMLYLGYVGFTVPFAFAVGSLVTGRVDEGWLADTRRWTLFAWGCLTVGIVLGAWWSYEVLGWGGYWAWDPVENASFLPWLVGTAYLHSAMVQERRGMLRVWNLSLLLSAFSLTILGTFLTRSGVLESVHSFTESPIGPWLLTFFAVIVVVVLGLIGWRGDRLRSSARIESPVSKEGAFLVNNLLFAAFALVVLVGTVFPLVLEAFNGERIAVGRPYFDRMTMPIGIALLFMMAMAPVLPWKRASGELLRQRLLGPAVAGTVAVVVAVALGARGLAPLLAFGTGAFASGAALRQIGLSVSAARRRGDTPWRGLLGSANGGMVVHVGVVIVAVAFTASSSYTTSRTATLDQGETVEVAGHTATFLGMVTKEDSGKTTFNARVRIDGGQVYEPALTQFRNVQQLIGTPSVRTSLTEDVYLKLDALPSAAGGPAVVTVIVEPLVTWLWVGGGVMAFGTALAAWPGSHRRRRSPSDPRAEGVLDRDSRDDSLERDPVTV